MKKCCCGCMTVRTGTLVLAILGLIGAGCNVLQGIYYLLVGDPSIQQYENAVANIDESQLNQDQREILDSTEDLMEFYKAALPYMATFTLVTSVIHLIVYGLLVAGVNKARHGYMIPALVVDGIYLGLGVLAIVGGSIAGFALLDSFYNPYIIAFLVGGSIGALVGFYFWFVMYSHYSDVKMASEGRLPLVNPQEKYGYK